MSISFEGIGQWCATFACEGMKEGAPVKMAENDKVGICGGGEDFCGVAVAVGASVVMSHYFTVMNIWQWIGMALVVVVSGTLGDLIESSMKREMQIKDSGNILPGHGGLLDRFDSTLFAIPSVIVYLAFIGIL
jgi:CDP-diglyceride synthetase